MARGQFIPDDSTLEDVVPTLRDAEKLVRGVLENMYVCKREHGGALASIGVVGRGIVPNYLIEFALDPFSVFGAFNGRSHKLLVDEDALKPNWSKKRMTLDQVSAVLGSIRDAKKR
jgi:hypothetical protein